MRPRRSCEQTCEALLVWLGFAFLVVVLGVTTVGALRKDEAPVRAWQAKTAALRCVGVGVAQRPRRRGEDWEVDVVRPNGSLVEVTIGDQLELLELDEEYGPGRRPAHDEASGPLREQAVQVALTASGPGRVLSVEREPNRQLEATEVNIRRANGDVEVGLDSELRVVEVEPQHPGDE